ncbi:hypothetical protein [Streptomyces mirabilis]|nr:hypothetical protein [Streptomyces mirabilis]MCX4423079.1 hypothetical protein [Streptomyces mirabilis]
MSRARWHPPDQVCRESSRVPIFAATVSAEPSAYEESIASYVIRA